MQKNISKISFLLIVLFSISCTSVKREFKEKYGRPRGPYIEKRALDHFEAHDSVYSLLFFTSCYKDKVYLVENGNKIIYDGKLKSDSSLGVAKVIRIKNDTNVKIIEKDRNFSFVLKAKHLAKYKYIYIEKDCFSKHSSYKVIFSNSFNTFM